jgi:uncharacterized membrane protein YjdF
MTKIKNKYALVSAVILVATVAQLLLATYSSLPQFEGKAFGARLLFYPLMMLAVPVAWSLIRFIRPKTKKIRWDGVAAIMLPFLIDVTGNTFDLYDSIWWWDDLNHFLNWMLLTLGIGLIIRSAKIPAWALCFLVIGFGAFLAIGWELAEWWAFIRHGTEIATAYEDTLGDLALGTFGSVVSGIVFLIRK